MKMVHLKVILVICIMQLVGITLAEQYRTVRTLNGDVRGKLEETLFHRRPFHSFRGIPFAEPPLGELRFKRPVPITNWNGVKDTFEFGNECTQPIGQTVYTLGAEDCLYLNVFVPETTSNESHPVMFYIHGGGYTTGSANPYSSDFLIPHNVIVVTINYRLGVLGFASLGTPEYSGNMGLKDQWLALKWVNDNIEAFGGDKTKITIFGHSAGGGSVHAQTISPKSRGLFKRAIVQSGAVLNPWSEYLEGNHLNDLMEFGKQFGNVTDNIDDLIRYLKEVDRELLVPAFNLIFFVPGEERKYSHILWAPLVEAANAIDPFLNESPIEILKRPLDSDIDTLFGFASAEMYGFIIQEIVYPHLLKPFNENFEIQLPLARLRYNYDSEGYRAIARDIRKFYFPKNGEVNAETLYEYNQLVSDVWFVYGIIESARLQYRHSTGKTYLYRFSVESELNPMEILSGINLRERNLNGSIHAEDALYLFRLLALNYEQFSEDSVVIQTIKLVTEMWANFAKFGTPTVPADPNQFKPIDSNALHFGDITNDGLITGVNPSDDVVKFWDEIYVKYRDVFYE